MSRALRKRFGHARAKKVAPDPVVYLSMSEGYSRGTFVYRVINQGVPISADKPTAREALAVAEHFKLKVADRMWDGINGKWAALEYPYHSRFDVGGGR